MKNIIVHGIDEAEGTDPLERRASDIKEIQNILKDFCEVELKDEDIVKSMRVGKYDQTKKWPILIAVKTEDKTRKPYGFMQSSFWVIMMVHVMVCGDL